MHWLVSIVITMCVVLVQSAASPASKDFSDLSNMSSSLYSKESSKIYSSSESYEESKPKLLKKKTKQTNNSTVDGDVVADILFPEKSGQPGNKLHRNEHDELVRQNDIKSTKRKKKIKISNKKREPTNGTSKRQRKVNRPIKSRRKSPAVKKYMYEKDSTKNLSNDNAEQLETKSLPQQNVKKRKRFTNGYKQRKHIAENQHISRSSLSYYKSSVAETSENSESRNYGDSDYRSQYSQESTSINEHGNLISKFRILGSDLLSEARYEGSINEEQKDLRTIVTKLQEVARKYFKNIRNRLPDYKRRSGYTGIIRIDIETPEIFESSNSANGKKQHFAKNLADMLSNKEKPWENLSKELKSASLDVKSVLNSEATKNKIKREEITNNGTKIEGNDIKHSDSQNKKLSDLEQSKSGIEPLKVENADNLKHDNSTVSHKLKTNIRKQRLRLGSPNKNTMQRRFDDEILVRHILKEKINRMRMQNLKNMEHTQQHPQQFNYPPKRDIHQQVTSPHQRASRRKVVYLVPTPTTTAPTTAQPAVDTDTSSSSTTSSASSDESTKEISSAKRLPLKPKRKKCRFMLKIKYRKPK